MTEQGRVKRIYKAMLSAAPAHPSQQREGAQAAAIKAVRQHAGMLIDSLKRDPQRQEGDHWNGGNLVALCEIAIQNYLQSAAALTPPAPQGDSVHLTSPHHTANRDQGAVVQQHQPKEGA